MDIMAFIQNFVPSIENAELAATVSFGDLLTVEREIHAQEDRRNARTSEQKFQGIIPCLTDFHYLGNFMEVYYIFIDTHFKCLDIPVESSYLLLNMESKVDK